jgi:hypothetical protein
LLLHAVLKASHDAETRITWILKSFEYPIVPPYSYMSYER